jgi:predicted alpha/beta hydrolase
MLDELAPGYTRDDLAQHVRTEFSTFRWLLEPMLSRAGFEILTADYRGRVYGAYTSRILAAGRQATAMSR